MAPDPGLRVVEGTCHAIFAFDVGREIRMADAARILRAEPTPPAAPGRPPYLAFAQPPVRCVVPVASITADGRATRGEAAAVLYDFGAITIQVSIDATGTLADLARLGAALCTTDALANAARDAMEILVRRLGAAIDDAYAAPMVEEYLVFHAKRVATDVPVAAWTTAFAADLAAVLRAEPRPLSGEEIAHTLAARASYAPDDLVLVDWNAAFVARERIDDLLAVLAFANVQLLEMRFLDARLDESLDASYEAVRRENPRTVVMPTTYRGALELVARRQIDAALLFEHVRNAPKLLGDQYLARVYEHAARRFRLLDWNDAIDRKLEVLGTIYERLRDRSAIVRAEILEWIIIFFCLLGCVVPFLL